MGHRKLPKNKYLLPAEIVSTLLCVFLCLIVPLYKIVNDAVDLLWKNIDGCWWKAWGKSWLLSHWLSLSFVWGAYGRATSPEYYIFQKPSLLPLLPRLHSATEHFMLQTLKCQCWLWRWQLPKPIGVIYAPQLYLQAVCKVAQCRNARLAFFWNLLQSPGSKALIFFPRNLRCWKATRGFCQSFPSTSSLRLPASHNTTALTRKLTRLN